MNCARSNNKMQRTKRGSDGASPLILVFGGRLTNPETEAMTETLPTFLLAPYEGIPGASFGVTRTLLERDFGSATGEHSSPKVGRFSGTKPCRQVWDRQERWINSLSSRAAVACAWVRPRSYPSVLKAQRSRSRPLWPWTKSHVNRSAS